MSTRNAAAVALVAIEAAFSACSSNEPPLGTAPSQSCIVSVSPARQTVGGNGGTATVSLSTGYDCPWRTSTTENWISATAGGTGSGALSVTISPNFSYVFERSATVNVLSGALTTLFTIDQHGAATANMVGNWSGTVLIGSNTCDHAWSITTHADQRFSGTWTLSGGTRTPCAQSGTLQGRVTGWGTGEAPGFPIYDLVYSELLAASGCTRLEQGSFTSGSVPRTDQTTVFIQLIERLSCAAGSSPINRTLDISLVRR